jgi:hypothetical protein
MNTYAIEFWGHISNAVGETAGKCKTGDKGGNAYMDEIRIKDIKGYEGHEEGFMNLYGAIWSQAVRDEQKNQKCRLLVDLSVMLFPVLLKYERDDRRSYTRIQTIIGERYGRAGIETIMALEAEIEKRAPELLKLVQEKILEETDKWPDNSRRKIPVFEKKILKLREDILRSLDVVGIKEA